ncbi:MAG: DnaJ domain-containing protein [Chloroflexi bacterium]|nr:DnaJ domain-containing protein [Chloroflexota bacterium]
MKQEPDYYAVLQVDPQAEREVIQAAYRRLAAKYHPDVAPSPGASERMKLLNAAYEVLSNQEKRQAYDMRRAGSLHGHPASGAPLGRRLPWWLLPVAVVIVAVAFRLSPRLILILGPLLLVLWLVWSRRPSSSS